MLVGIGTIVGEPIKVRNFPKAERNRFYDRNYLQVPVNLTHVSTIGIFPANFLYLIPSMNEKTTIRAYHTKKIYWCNSLGYWINKLIHDYWWYFTYLADPGENEFRYWLHEMREDYFKFILYNRYEKIVSRSNYCTLCGIGPNLFKSFRANFLQLHEKVYEEDMQKYRKYNEDNFLIVCPNCHAKEHLKIKNQ